MNDTTVIGAAGQVEEDVRAYVLAVRAWLGDLPADEVEDLTAGMEADLAERAAESGGPLGGLLGEPEAYAAELRASAGLPSRGRSSQATVTRLTRTLDAARASLLAQPWVAPVLGFLTSVRPVWWVLRAWVLVAAVCLAQWGPVNGWSTRLPLVPHVGSGAWGLLVVFVVAVLSVQAGRHAWAPRGRRNLTVANVLLVLAAAPVLTSLAHVTQWRMGRTVEIQYLTRAPEEGVISRGESVRNIYPYDANGHLLTDVRLYDDTGRPLDLQLGQDPNRRSVFDSTGQPATNAYPYRYFEPGTRVVANPLAGPQVTAPPLVPQPMKPAATASPSASPSATATTP